MNLTKNYKCGYNLTDLYKIDNLVSKIESRVNKLKNLVLISNKCNPVIVQQNKKKCQPAARDTQDLIQTWCVPDRGLAHPQNKNKLNKNK